MADVQDYLVLFLVWLVTVLLVQALLSRRRGPRYRLPPSPFRLPVIGHLHLIRSLPHVALHNLARRYGPLCHLSFGSVPCAIVSSPDMAREFLKLHETSFCNRPSTVAIRLLTYGASDFSFAPYGPYWKFMKKICMTELLNGRILDQLLPIRCQEIDVFYRTMVRYGDACKEVNVGEELMTLANNIISRMTMSKRCASSSDEAADVRELIEEMRVLTGVFNFQDYIGLCKNLDVQGLGKRLRELHGRLDAMMEKILKEHEEAKERDDAGYANKDLVDILLKFTNDETSEMKLSRESVKAFILEMFTTGTGTSGGMMQWALAELINHPDVVKKAREEIDSVVGKSRLVSESDIASLPYVQAIVKETLRLHPVGPIFTREATEHCNIGGYDIPAETRVIINVWAIGRDPDAWENPLEFRPERFVGENETASVDVRGQQYQLLPFGSGRRGCPGASLALQVIQTTVAGMIQCFDWKVSESENNVVDMTEAAGLVLFMAKPLMCTPIIRLNPFTHVTQDSPIY